MGVNSSSETQRRCFQLEQRVLTNRSSDALGPGAEPLLKEPLLHDVVAALLRHDHLPPGGLLDAGAHLGEFSCFMASLAPRRSVLAVEPVQANIIAMKKVHAAAGLSNVRHVRGGLGRENKFVRLEDAGAASPGAQVAGLASNAAASHRTAGQAPSASLELHRIDDLHAASPLGFAHLDVEGDELHALHGAAMVLARDRPLVSTELHAQQASGTAARVLAFFGRRNYTSFVVDEECSVRVDGRNALHVPAEWLATSGASVLRPWMSQGALLRVDEAWLHALWPCCRPGAACCPDGPVALTKAWTPDNNGVSCCTKRIVDRAYAAAFAGNASSRLTSPACEARLNTWCRSNCAHLAHHNLVARIAGDPRGQVRWRCYASDVLSADRRHYVGPGRQFCTREDALRRLVGSCE